jgi:hypothetical protein
VMTMKNAILWDVALQSATTCSRWFLARGFFTLKMEAILSSETSVHTITTTCHIPENGSLPFIICSG